MSDVPAVPSEKSPQTVDIALDRIEEVDAYDLPRIDSLADSMKESGLLQPIVLEQVGPTYAVVAGRHRVAAARKLGWLSIAATVRMFETVVDRKMATITENVTREHVSARDVRYRQRLLTDLMEAKYGKANVKGGRPKAGATSAKKEVAKKLNTTKSTLNRNIARREKASPEVQKAFEHGKLKASQVDELIRLPKDEQAALIDRVADLTKAKTAEVVRSVLAPAEETAATSDAGSPEGRDMADDGAPANDDVEVGPASVLMAAANEFLAAAKGVRRVDLLPHPELLTRIEQVRDVVGVLTESETGNAPEPAARQLELFERGATEATKSGPAAQPSPTRRKPTFPMADEMTGETTDDTMKRAK